MTNIIVFVVGFMIGLVATFLFTRKGNIKTGNLNNHNQEVKTKKNEAKLRILNYLKENNFIVNRDVEIMLNVSDATATRYLQELEDEGKIIQEGNTKGATYRIK